MKYLFTTDGAYVALQERDHCHRFPVTRNKLYLKRLAVSIGMHNPPYISRFEGIPFQIVGQYHRIQFPYHLSLLFLQRIPRNKPRIHLSQFHNPYGPDEYELPLWSLQLTIHDIFCAIR